RDPPRTGRSAAPPHRFGEGKIPRRRKNLGFTRQLWVEYNRSMKQIPTAGGSEAEPTNLASFHRPGEDMPYGKFTRDLQFWRGEQLRKYYADLENPQF